MRKIIEAGPIFTSSWSASLVGAADSLPAQISPVPAAEIFQDRAGLVDHDSRVTARDEGVVDPDGGIFIASKQVLAMDQGDFAVSPDEPVDLLPVTRGGIAAPDLLGRSTERVAEAVHGAHETGVPGAVPGRRPDLGEKARERALRDERAGPEALVDLALRQGSGTALKKQLQKLEGLGREVNGLAVNRELPRTRVEHVLPESNPHRCSRRNPGTFQCFSNDFPASRRHLDYHARRGRRTGVARCETRTLDCVTPRRGLF